MGQRRSCTYLQGFLFLVVIGWCSLASTGPLRVAVLPYLSFAPLYIGFKRD
ncbi:hypothetical protein SAMN02745124_03686 [Desulfofustis glycolicus DSM 9705]|uniref:Uncharacterized protein n=1 Tax=Desulfofustis glycolicus DSM 9705 TaxID=1121409 RepID=A0A1M5Y6K2_9BACT|nr:hypothetical protein SAMN02745124_03686 [Desulfofustis glycolicus DSM 9705]